MPYRRSPRLALVAAAALFSTSGAAIKGTTLSGWQVAGLRSLIAGTVILVAVPAARRGWGWRSTLVGLFYAATMITFVLGIRLTTSANAIFLQSANPVYILLLGPLLLGERARPRDLVALSLAVAGLGCVFFSAQAATRIAPDPATGNLLAAASGLVYAGTIMGLRWLSRDPSKGSPENAAVIGNYAAFLVAVPFLAPIGAHPAGDWVVLAYLGIFQMGLAYTLVTFGIGMVTAFEAAMLFLLEPVLNPIFTWMVHREMPAPAALLGGLLILGGTVTKSLLDARAAKIDPVVAS